VGVVPRCQPAPTRRPAFQAAAAELAGLPGRRQRRACPCGAQVRRACSGAWRLGNCWVRRDHLHSKEHLTIPACSPHGCRPAAGAGQPLQAAGGGSAAAAGRQQPAAVAARQAPGASGRACVPTPQSARVASPAPQLRAAPGANRAAAANASPHPAHPTSRIPTPSKPPQAAGATPGRGQSRFSRFEQMHAAALVAPRRLLARAQAAPPCALTRHPRLPAAAPAARPTSPVAQPEPGPSPGLWLGRARIQPRSSRCAC
jgi:hypothetical protein